MFDIGWSEMLVIAVVMIVVVGPKDLPRMLRTFGKTTSKLRSMAGDFQKQFNEALKEAELDDIKDSVDQLRKLNPAGEIKKQLNPFEKAAADLRSGLDSAMKPKVDTSAKPADVAAHAAEPLKNGAASATDVGLPGIDVPIEMPKPAVFADTSAEPAAKAARAAAPVKKASTSKSAGGAVKPAAAAKAKPVAAAAKSRAKPAAKPAKAPAKTTTAAAKAPAGTAKAARKSPGKSK